jgi:hypothetical protein
MNATDTTPLDILEAELRAEGYHPGAPAGLPAAAAEIDRSVAREASCDSCGHAGLYCSAWHKCGSYRCIAACPQCLEAFEF